MCFIRLLVCPEHSQLEVVQIEFCNLARRPDAISHDQAGASFAIGKNRAVSLDKAKTLCPRGVRLLAAVKMHSCTGGEPLPLGLWNDGAGNEAQYNGPIPEQRIKEGLDHVSQADGSPNPANPVPDSDAAQQTRETGGNTAHDSQVPTVRITMHNILNQACQRTFWWLSDRNSTPACTPRKFESTRRTQTDEASPPEMSL